MTDEKNVDESWKKQAQADKEKADATPRAAEPLPADFAALVASLASGALLALGVLPDASGKAPAPDFERAQYAIDLLDMLAEKTKGNLSPDEDRQLQGALHELHLAFVDATQRAGK